MTARTGMKWPVAVALAALLGACASPADYMRPPREAVEYGAGAKPIYPD